MAYQVYRAKSWERLETISEKTTGDLDFLGDMAAEFQTDNLHFVEAIVIGQGIAVMTYQGSRENLEAKKQGYADHAHSTVVQISETEVALIITYPIGIQEEE